MSYPMPPLGRVMALPCVYLYPSSLCVPNGVRFKIYWQVQNFITS